LSPGWKEQLQKRISGLKDLPEGFSLTGEEQAFFQSEIKNKKFFFPFTVTPYYFSLIDWNNPSDPVRKQCIPTVKEILVREYEKDDPLCENDFSPVPFLIHRYPDRALVLVTDICACYCRHCFRRSITRCPDGRIIGEEELDRICGYIKNHREINEVILSGGDPLILDNQLIYFILKRIKEIRSTLTFRMATRIPVVLPQRIEPGLIDILKEFKPLWVVSQFNHPVELNETSREAAARLIDNGIPILNQAVLLKGINDNLDTLLELCRKLVSCRIKPYYLFQGDLAKGISHLRTPISEGLALYSTLIKDLSGIARPVYALDLPDGGGKVTLNQTCMRLKKDKYWEIENDEGKVYRYPEEK
jgi:lysine 2,3-aminomutase